MKRKLTLLLLLGVVTTAHSQQTPRFNKLGVQRLDTVFQFNIASYHCFSSSFLAVTIRKECDAYVADWRTHYGKMTLQKPGSGTVVLTEGQLTALSNFAQQVSPAAVHNENCSGTTYFKFTSDSFNKEQRLCDCAQNVWSEILTINDYSKQGSAQHQL